MLLSVGKSAHGPFLSQRSKLNYPLPLTVKPRLDNADPNADGDQQEVLRRPQVTVLDNE